MKNRKLTQEEINEIRCLHKEGKKQKEIASKLGSSQQTISYWLSSEEKRKEISKKSYESFKKKPLAERKRIYKRRLPYIRKWIREKYQGDEEFRKKQINRLKEYRKKK